MEFKMKGFPKLSGIGGVQAEKNLQKELKSMATGKSKTKEPTMSYEEFAKKNPGTARYLTKEQYEAKIKKLKSGFKMKGFSPFDKEHERENPPDNQRNPSNIEKIGDETVTIGGKEYSDMGLKDEFIKIRRAGEDAPLKGDGSPNYPAVDRKANPGEPGEFLERPNTPPRNPRTKQ